MTKFIAAAAGIAALFATGCNTTAPAGTPYGVGPSATNNYAEVGATGAEAGSRIGNNQFIQMAEDVTRKMTFSDQFIDITVESSPTIVFGTIRNRTNDEGLQLSNAADKVREILLGTGAVRVALPSSNKYEYVLAATMTSDRLLSRDSTAEYNYILKLDLTTLDGVYVGTWSSSQRFRERLF